MIKRTNESGGKRRGKFKGKGGFCKSQACSSVAVGRRVVRRHVRFVNGPKRPIWHLLGVNNSKFSIRADDDPE